MLDVSNLTEALAELKAQTGRDWTASELLNTAAVHGFELFAAPPLDAVRTVREFQIGAPDLVENFRGRAYCLAVLYPVHVHQLWLGGETETMHACTSRARDGEHHFFMEPVRVTHDNLRIEADTLCRIIKLAKMAREPVTPENYIEAAHVRRITGEKPAPRNPKQSAVKRVQPGDDDWKELAQAEARKIIAREAKAGRFPPQLMIADEIAADFRNRKSPVLGTDGKPLSGETIKRHALSGISSATKKAQSTAISRGK